MTTTKNTKTPSASTKIKKSRKNKPKSKTKKTAELRMSEKSLRNDGSYTPTIKVGLESPLTLNMDGKFVWGKYKPISANKN